VRVDGAKELVAITDGFRESTESWADLLRDLKRRGMRAPVLAVGHGARGFPASAKARARPLRHLKPRGLRAPVLAVGDGALGFWGALREVFPATRTQRCWFHKIANVLSAPPKSAHPGAKKALAEIW